MDFFPSLFLTCVSISTFDTQSRDLRLYTKWLTETTLCPLFFEQPNVKVCKLFLLSQTPEILLP